VSSPLHRNTPEIIPCARGNTSMNNIPRRMTMAVITTGAAVAPVLDGWLLFRWKSGVWIPYRTISDHGLSDFGESAA